MTGGAEQDKRMKTDQRTTSAKTSPQPAPASVNVVPQQTPPRPSALEGSLARLVKLEAGIRQVRSFNELTYFIANEFRQVTRAQQVYVVRRGGPAKLRVEAITSLAFVDRSAPIVAEFEQMLATMEAEHGLDATREFDAGAFQSGPSSAAQSYPLPHLLWVPFRDLEGMVIGGMLQARSMPWAEQDVTIANHLAGAASFAWLAVMPQAGGFGFSRLATKRRMWIMAAVVVVLSFFPVSMSALAPAEVSPRTAFVVTAGVDGVVDAVDADPNSKVVKDQVLVRIADTVLRNRYEVAQRDVLVAEAHQKKASQLAFVDMRGRHELAVAQSELELKIAERNYAREMLERATVKAERAGVAFYADKKDLIGRPVAVGEKLMEIVDPADLEFQIELPVADAIVLKPGARIKVFLDSDPLRPVEAVLVRSDYKARLNDAQQLAFRLIAEPDKAQGKALRLGVRGTAQIYSDKTPLIFYLLRRPLASARQFIGW